MSSTDDLIQAYERRLADFEGRLAAMESDREQLAAPAAASVAPKRSGAGYRLGVDVGGTFTHVLLLDEKRSRTFIAKGLSPRGDSSIGVLTGIEKICRDAG